uniref:Uncharacterized protein n=1 Tax=Anguilla anguilla TaxID=7936 RepID=A0A0E9XE29_ANGAN
MQTVEESQWTCSISNRCTTFCSQVNEKLGYNNLFHYYTYTSGKGVLL